MSDTVVFKDFICPFRERLVVLHERDINSEFINLISSKVLGDGSVTKLKLESKIIHGLVFNSYLVTHQLNEYVIYSMNYQTLDEALEDFNTPIEL